MIKERMDCIDCGTEYCPCHLAESGECIMCSQLQGECFCDCVNWKGVCVYQELFNNGMKAKEGRKTYNCEVTFAEEIDEGVIMIKFIAPHKLAIDLVKPGSYIIPESCPVIVVKYVIKFAIKKIVIDIARMFFSDTLSLSKAYIILSETIVDSKYQSGQE